MKIKITHGTGTNFEIEVPDGSTVETCLKHPSVVTICGEQGAARLDTAEVAVDTKVKEGQTLEPVTVANEKAA